jgi:3-oxoadipate enol-lactonase
MPLIQMNDGVRLFVERAGPLDAPSVLFAHSVGCDLTLWDGPFETLAKHYGVIRYDARGHGRSDAPPGDYKLDRLTADSLAVLDWAGVMRAHVCGLSLGGTVGLSLALQAPERIVGLVLANSSARMGTPQAWQDRMDGARRDGMEAMADFSMTRFFSQAFRQDHPQTVARFRHIFATTAADGYAGCCAVLRDSDFRSTLDRVSIPTLVVTGLDDVPIPPSDGTFMSRQIKHSQCVSLSTGHLSAVEDPDTFSSTLEEWLAGYESPPPP